VLWYIRTSKSRIEHALSHYFHANLQLHNSPGTSARKLFKPSNDVANLYCIEKSEKFLFQDDIISEVGFRQFWLR